MSDGENVKVAVRCRPLSLSEQQGGHKAIVEITPGDHTVSLLSTADVKQVPTSRVCFTRTARTYTFDAVYGSESRQETIYRDCAQPIVTDVLKGYNATIFAYGQTGTGKTYTMQGGDEEDVGITPRVFAQIFETITQSTDTEYLVRASYLELYNEELHDLLDKHSKAKLELKENKEKGVYVKNLRTVIVESVQDMNKVLQIGGKNRAVGQTLMNKDSSRSHSIFTITIESLDRNGVDGDSEHIRVGKLHLVDLAGSERQSKTGSTGERFKEATNINLSLSCLGNVISALSDKSQRNHIPFRDSKLTRLIQDSLGGNSKTLMFANIGPADYNYEETMSTLRYANRAKDIKNKPKINEDPKDAMLREFQNEIATLRTQLESLEHPKDDDCLAETPDVSQSEQDALREEMRNQLREEQRALSEKASMEEVERLIEDRVAAEVHRLNEERKQSNALREENFKSLQVNEEHGKQKEQEMENISTEKKQLQQRLRAIEKKLLKGEKHGGVAAVAALKEEKLQKNQDRLLKRLENEAKQHTKMKELEEASLETDRRCKTLQDTVQQKTELLEKTIQDYQTLSKEAEGLTHTIITEKNQFMETMHSLQHQLDIKDHIIEAFIPPIHQDKIVKSAQWNEETEEWDVHYDALLSPLPEKNRQRRPRSEKRQRRPTSALASMAVLMGDSNPRFRGENLLTLSPERPNI